MAPGESRFSGKVAVLGAGKMGGILLSAFFSSGMLERGQVHATVAHAERALALSQRLGVRCGTENLEAAREADLILLGVKPSQVVDVVRSIAPALNASKLLISIAASVSTSAIEAGRATASPSSAQCRTRQPPWVRA